MSRRKSRCFEHLSVAENVFAGQTNLGRGVLVRQRRLEERTAALFADFGLSFSPRALLASLTAAQRHLVMIVRALATRPTVLMLDEPTASLSGAEVTRLFRLLKRLKAQGTTMIFITHRLPEVLALCDRATVLRDGRVAAEIVARGIRQRPHHRRHVGPATARASIPSTQPRRAPAAFAGGRGSRRSRAARLHRGLHDINFELRAGEILGIAGLLGSGRTELLGAIYGRIPYRGRICVEGREVAINSTQRRARKAGIALLTEDRKRSGLLFNLPLRGNITIGNLDLFARRGIVSSQRRGQRRRPRHARIERQGALALRRPCRTFPAATSRSSSSPAC